MSYKWKPSASQRRAFKIRMQDPTERAAYEARKTEKEAKRRANSAFDYKTAGGFYVPTKFQNTMAFKFLSETSLSTREVQACNEVVSAYSCNSKTHHDNIHIVNELIRAEN